MSEFLSRIVSKGLGKSSASSAPRPDLLPYFPPVAGNSGQLEIDSKAPAAIQRISAPAASAVSPLASRGPHTGIAPGAAGLSRFNHEVPAGRLDAARVVQPSAEIIPAPPPPPFALPREERQMARAVPAFPMAENSARNATEQGRSRNISAEDAQSALSGVAALLQNEQISQITSASRRDVRKARAGETRSGTNENRAGRIVIEPREPVEGSKPAARQQPARVAQPAAGGDSVVQVHIGKVEVRVNAPPTPPAPSAPTARGPRGFSEYAAIRRYLTRNRI